MQFNVKMMIMMMTMMTMMMMMMIIIIIIIIIMTIMIMITIITTIIMMMMIIIIMIALKSSILSPTRKLKLKITCKSRATHRALITCNMSCAMWHARNDSSAIGLDIV